MNIALSLLFYLSLIFISNIIRADSRTDTSASTVPLAPGYSGLDYTLPTAGSYALPPFGKAADGEVLDSHGQRRRLYELFGDKFVLLSFMYSTCNDVNGCPLTSFVFYKISAIMQKDASLADNLRLISLSFDPQRDTPEVMKLYGNNFVKTSKAGHWLFLTTASEPALQPILNAYNQDIQRKIANSDGASNDISHILRVFLIDREKRIRNIYSVAFLHTDLVLNDVRTLLMEGQDSAGKITPQPIEMTSKFRAGDDKSGYEQYDYQTRSMSLKARQGQAAELLALAKNPPLGLPAVPIPLNNPLTQEKISLGRKLFYDRRLSLNDTFSCAMCHIPEQGFTSQELATAIGIEGRTVRRNSPTIYNVAFLTRLFHDGREHTLEQQIWSPLLAKNEMGNPSIGTILNKISHLSDYQGLFKTAFGERGLSMETLGEAIASYERTLNSANSPFDQWYFGKNMQAVNEPAKRGYALFSGKANCVSCHSINKEYALFTDNSFHNTGIGYHNSMKRDPETQRVQVAPGVYLDVDAATINSVSEKRTNDLGRYEITQNPGDRWKYRTPSLRNIALTAPYMHDGSVHSLRAVIEFYNRGGEPNELLSPLIKPLLLNDEEKNDLLEFLRTLTGANVSTLIADAFAAPVGDPKNLEQAQQ